jgi:hypothetical protein
MRERTEENRVGKEFNQLNRRTYTSLVRNCRATIITLEPGKMQQQLQQTLGWGPRGVKEAATNRGRGTSIGSRNWI